MQPAPPDQPARSYVPQPARAGWGRFWLGVLTGGCGLLLLEALALTIVVVVIGSTVGAALRGNGGGLPALPGGLPLPSALPGVSAHSDPCSPQPCMAHDGVAVLVGNVNRNAGAASESGSHLVKVDLTFVGTSGTHTVTPASVTLRDPSGSMTLAGADEAAAACGDASVSTDLAAGQKAGPYSVCYAVSGSASAPLTLIWVNPEDLSVVELSLP